MLRFCLTALTMCATITVVAQRNPEPPIQVEPLYAEDYNSDVGLSPDFDGTFQITSESCNVNITKDFVTYINSLRSEDEDVVVDLSGGRSVLIVARTKMEDPAFVPFDKMVICNQ